MQNAMYVIQIYRHAGTWCFTDTERGLIHEPFVLGIPKFIDKNIEINELGSLNQDYKVIFSERCFPTYHGFLTIQEHEQGGAWYQMSIPEDWGQTGESSLGWLCPATLKFFSEFPKEIYFKLEPVET